MDPILNAQMDSADALSREWEEYMDRDREGGMAEATPLAFEAPIGRRPRVKIVIVTEGTGEEPHDVFAYSLGEFQRGVDAMRRRRRDVYMAFTGEASPEEDIHTAQAVYRALGVVPARSADYQPILDIPVDISGIDG